MKRTELKRNTELKRKSELKRSGSLKTSKPAKRRMPKKSTYTKTLREYIKERDGGLCQVCGRPGQEVHHVIPKGRFYYKWYTIDDVNDERNLMYICRPCHHKATDNNDVLEQLIEMQEKRFGKLRREFG